MINCTIIINSCESYSDAWDVFFELLFRNWKEVGNYHIMLNTDQGNYVSNKIQIDTHTYIGEEKPTWSEQLLSTLNVVNDEYVLIMLEDDWINSKVDDDEFQCCLNDMETNDNLVLIDFTPLSPTDGKQICNGKYIIKRRFEKYRLNCQVGLWRKQYLASILRRNESPWEFEIYGSRRSALKKGAVYRYRQKDGLLFDYDWGNPIVRGKWNKEYIEKTERLHGLKIDTSRREFLNDAENFNSEKKTTGIKKIIRNIRALF